MCSKNADIGWTILPENKNWMLIKVYEFIYKLEILDVSEFRWDLLNWQDQVNWTLLNNKDIVY